MRSPRVSSVNGFTLVELLTVVAIIIVLMGLTLGVSGFVREKGARNRAQAEIAAMEAALEQYRIDNGGYPFSLDGGGYETKTNPDTVGNKMRTSNVPAGDLRLASFELFKALSGFDKTAGEYVGKTYFEFPPQMLEGADSKNYDPGNVTAVIDPWGFPYGYYLPDPADPTTMAKNPTIDLYSTANTQNKAKDMDIDQLHEAWVTNW